MGNRAKSFSLSMTFKFCYGLRDHSVAIGSNRIFRKLNGQECKFVAVKKKLGNRREIWAKKSKNRGKAWENESLVHEINGSNYSFTIFAK